MYVSQSEILSHKYNTFHSERKVLKGEENVIINSDAIARL